MPRQQSRLKIGQDVQSHRENGYGYRWHLMGAAGPICGRPLTNISARQDYWFPVENLTVYNVNRSYGEEIKAYKLTDLVRSFLCEECVSAGLRSLLQDSGSDGKSSSSGSGDRRREQSEADTIPSTETDSLGFSTRVPVTSPRQSQQYNLSSPSFRQMAYPNYVSESGSLSTPSFNSPGGITGYSAGATTNGVRRSGYSRIRDFVSGRS